MLIDWYGVDKERIDVVSNGAPSRYLTAPSSPVNPYPHGLHFALLVAPKNMLPNELAVEYTLRVAERLQALPNTDDIRIAVAGGGWQSEQIEKFPNLVYLGFAKDILAYIDHADVCVLPYPREAVCGGARNKALDYFAREKIVLSTLEGMRGLTDFKPGEHVFHSSYEPEKFTNDLIEIFCNPEKFRHLGKNARRLVEVDYNWQRSAEKVMTVFRKVI
jgi:glycosyltransferase involved in cell wall biosynthesis